LNAFRVETPIGVVIIKYQESLSVITQIKLPSVHKIKMEEIESSFKQFPRPVKKVSKLISDCFKGKSLTLPWEIFRLNGMTSLEKTVLYKTAGIPFGSTKTYKEIAESISRPKAYRFVGTTMAKNPFPILIPCHRVIRSDKKIGGFAGGSELKKKMIDYESGYGL